MKKRKKIARKYELNTLISLYKTKDLLASASPFY